MVKRFIDFINGLFNKKFGRYASEYKINTGSDLKAVMDAFVAASEYGAEVSASMQSVADQNVSTVTDARSTAYPGLKDKVVRFVVYYPNRFGGPSSAVYREVKVNDYWHLRNWWAAMTGNGKLSGIVTGKQ